MNANALPSTPAATPPLHTVPSATPPVVAPSRWPRRAFLRAGATVVLTATLLEPWRNSRAHAASTGDRSRSLDMRLGGRDLVVQPVLMYNLPQRQPARSWRNWGGLQTQAAVDEEVARIDQEAKELVRTAGFGLQLQPLAKVTNPAEAAALRDSPADTLLVYAAGSGTETLQALAASGKRLLIFVRYKSGPYYLWHEIVDSRFLRNHTDQVQQPNVGLDDVVVDESAELRWRLQALYGLKNTLGRRIVCVGGPGGWSWPKAPELARERFQLDMIDLPIPELNAKIEASRKDAPLMARCQREAQQYVQAAGVKLDTTPQAVQDAFLLKHLFHDLMNQADAFAVTVRGCMASYAGIMPCLTLTLVNDDGYMAYCEGDFVVIPSGILLHFIAGKPTYFCNPTYPHQGRMMFAHCTAPRRMDGRTLEPANLVTHYESDHGAATHVHFRKGQLLTIVKPDFEAKHWLALTGKILDTPFTDTCRAQVEVELNADTHDVLRNLRGFHCMLAYGDYTRELAYAAHKVGIQVQVLRS
ncbi:MAG: sugar isomerase [Verrucomicrobia bacterium]|nr:sugar isomerase [Verrucomicrobiota bacterium]